MAVAPIGSFRPLSVMRSETHHFDWSLFWLLQVILVSVPTLVTVMAFRDGPSLSQHKAMVLGCVVIALTVLNVIIGMLLKISADRLGRH